MTFSSAPVEFRPSVLLGSERYKELDRRQAYAECRQHDYKAFDFDGRMLSGSSYGAAMTAMPMITAEMFGAYVPLRARRPSAPYRLAKSMTGAFTNLIFGQQRFPQIRVEGDPITQDWVAAVVKAGKLPKKMIAARNSGGGAGTVGISWCFDRRGKPRFQVHQAKHLFVHRWEDREGLIPSHVSETYVFPNSEWDPERGKFVERYYWYRRDWTPDGDLVFADQPFVPGKDPIWGPPIENLSTMHDHGECHLHWIQNLETDEPDGLPDYDGEYENLDILDTLFSVLFGGGIKNFDPTLVLRLGPEIEYAQAAAGTIKKGSDNALSVGASGDAKYLELAGSSVEVGLKLLAEKRKTVLESCQCILADPNELAAQGVSSVALKAMYAPMLGKTDVMRDQYGIAMESILTQMVDYARERVGTRVSVSVQGGTEEVELEIQLPPRIERIPRLDPDGVQMLDEAGKALEELRRIPRLPGEGGDIELAWPDYFPATPDDKMKTTTALAAANGGKAILSQQTTVEAAAALYGHEADEEWARVQKQHAADKAAEDAAALEQAKAFSSNGDYQGGKVDPEEEKPSEEGDSSDEEETAT